MAGNITGNVIGRVTLLPCPSRPFQLSTLGGGEELSQELSECPFPQEPSLWDTSLLLQPICAISTPAVVHLSKSGTCSSYNDVYGYWCNFCQFSSESKAEFAQHVITHRFSCQFCLFSSFTRSHVILHMNAIHAEKEATRGLKYCVLSMDMVGEVVSEEEREPLPPTLHRRLIQSLSLSGEVFKKRKHFGQDEGRLSKVAKRFPSDNPSPLSHGHRGLPSNGSGPRLEIDNAEDAVLPEAAEDLAQARRQSPSQAGGPPAASAAHGISMSDSPRPASNCSSIGSSSTLTARSGPSMSSSQAPSEGVRGFQTLRKLLIQPGEASLAKPIGRSSLDVVAPVLHMGARGASSPEDQCLPLHWEDEEDWMSDTSHGSSGNSSESDEYRFHGSLKGIDAKSHQTRYRQRCVTTSTSSSSSDHPRHRGRSSSMMHSSSHAAAERTTRVRSNSLCDESNSSEKASERSDKYPLLFQYLTQESILDEHIRRKSRASQPSQKPSDFDGAQLESPILRQCLSQISQKSSGKDSCPVPSKSSTPLPFGVSIKQEPDSSDYGSHAAAASLAPSTAAGCGEIQYAESVGNGGLSSSPEREITRTGVASSGPEEQGESFHQGQVSHISVKQEPVDDSFQINTSISTPPPRTSPAPSLIPSSASRSREYISSPQLPRESPPIPVCQPPSSSTEGTAVRSRGTESELRRLLAGDRVSQPQKPGNTEETVAAAAAAKERVGDGRGEGSGKKMLAALSSALEHPPSTGGSSLLRSVLLQADEVPPTASASRRASPGSSSASASMSMPYSRLLQSLVPHSQSQGTGGPRGPGLLPQLLSSSPSLAPPTASTSSSTPSTQCSGQPMDLSKRGPSTSLPSLETGTVKQEPLLETSVGKQEASPVAAPSEQASSAMERDDSSSGMKFQIEDVKSLSGSVSPKSDQGDPSLEKREPDTLGKAGSIADGEETEGGRLTPTTTVAGSTGRDMSSRKQFDSHTKDPVPDALNLTTSERTRTASPDYKEKSDCCSTPDAEPKPTSQVKTSLVSALLSSSSSTILSTSSTSTSHQPTTNGGGSQAEASKSPGRSSDGSKVSDPSPVAGSSKSPAVLERRPGEVNVDYHSLLQMKMGVGHYLPEDMDSSEHEEHSDTECNEENCSGHTFLWTDADKDVRKLTVETEGPSPEMGEGKRI